LVKPGRRRKRKLVIARIGAFLPKGEIVYKNILVPTDGSKLSVKSARQAVKLAKALGAKITGFYAAPDFASTYYGDGYILRAPSAKDHTDLLQKQARQYLSAIEVEAEVEKVPCEVFHAVSDSPYEAIIAAAKKKKCDLIFMASHGRRGLDALVLGSETQKVLIHSRIPVLVCR
jgi:nucleotide-binding universal stress UspA family protein